MSDAIRFWFRGRAVSLTDVPPGLSVLHWLRDHEHATGTKEGCNQGDCGACTVVVARLSGSSVSLSTANSCLLPIAALHGTGLLTIEDVGSGALHPVQQAMVEAGGSQCGFCTPGFVVSMWRALEQDRIDGVTRSREALADDLTGNLCRCTGYRPIVDAAVAASATMAREPEPTLDIEALRAGIAGLDADGPLSLRSAAGAYLSPVTEDGLAQALADNPRARIISGGTDLLPALHAGHLTAGDDLVLVATGHVAGMDRIVEEPDHLRIGAGATLEATWSALVDRLPELSRMHRRFAGPAIRSVGTVGGNIANASPIADLVPVLMALDARLTLRSATGSRQVELTDFPTGPRASVLAPGEFISSVAIPLAAFARDLRSHKVARRHDDDISAVSATFALVLDGTRIADVRVVLGGMAPTVRRAPAIESALRGREWDESTLTAAQAALPQEFTPITDHRASDHYRMRVASGLLRRWWLETSPLAPTVPVDVWARR